MAAIRAASFLNGSLTRLLDPDKVLRTKIVEFVEGGDFGMASGSLPGGKYQRVWFMPSADTRVNQIRILLSSASGGRGIVCARVAAERTR